MIEVEIRLDGEPVVRFESQDMTIAWASAEMYSQWFRCDESRITVKYQQI